MTDEPIEMPDDYVGSDDAWAKLKAGAYHEGGRRLGAYGDRLSVTVNDFAGEARDQVALVVAPSPAGDQFVWDMFKAVTDVVALVFPAEGVVEKFGMLALGSFRDSLTKSMAKDAATATAQREAGARAELRRVVTALAQSTIESGRSAADEAQYALDRDLEAFVEANPKYRALPVDSSTEIGLFGWFCDSIGVTDPKLVDFSPLIESLWDTFNRHLAATVSKARWDSMGTVEQSMFVAGLDADERTRLFAQLGIDDPFDP